MSRSRVRRPRVLVIGLQGLGNLLLSSSLLVHLEERADASVTVLVPDATAAELIGAIPGRREVVVASRFRRAALVAQLAARRFDTAIVAYPGGPRSVTLAWLSGARRRIGHVGRQGWLARALLSTALQPTPGRHDMEHNLELAECALQEYGVPATGLQVRFGLDLPPERRDRALAWIESRGLAGRPVVGVAPGSGWRQTFKRWPLERFIALIDDLTRAVPEVGAIWFVGPDEIDLSDRIAAAGLPAAVCLRAEGLDVLTVAALMSRCRAVVANDNGLMHLASQVGVPVVAVFGPTDGARSRPYGPESRLVASDVDCRPCYSANVVGFRCVNPRPFACIEDVSVSDVLQPLLESLSRSQDLAGGMTDDRKTG